MIRAALVALACLATPAGACIIGLDLDLRDAAMADLVLAGTVTASQREGEALVITIAPDAVLRGEAGESVTVVWTGGMAFGTDARLAAPGKRVIAAARITEPTAQLQMPNPRPDLPVIVHPACGHGLFLPDLPETRARLRWVLDQ